MSLVFVHYAEHLEKQVYAFGKQRCFIDPDVPELPQLAVQHEQAGQQPHKRAQRIPEMRQTESIRFLGALLHKSR